MCRLHVLESSLLWLFWLSKKVRTQLGFENRIREVKFYCYNRWIWILEIKKILNFPRGFVQCRETILFFIQYIYIFFTILFFIFYYYFFYYFFCFFFFFFFYLLFIWNLSSRSFQDVRMCTHLGLMRKLSVKSVVMRFHYWVQECAHFVGDVDESTCKNVERNATFRCIFLNGIQFVDYYECGKHSFNNEFIKDFINERIY